MSAPACPSLGRSVLYLIAFSVLPSLAAAFQGTPTVAFAPSLPTTLVEGGLGVDLFVELSAVQSADVIVPFELSGSASAGPDYVSTPASPLVIPAGSASASLNLVALVDGLYEGDEILDVTLLTPIGADLGSPAAHSLLLQDSDSAPLLFFEEPRTLVLENQGTVMVRVELSAASALPVVFSGLVGGTATAGVDYNAPAGPFQIDPGLLVYDVQVDLLDDGEVEGTEVLRLELSPALMSGATMGSPWVHRMRIRDDESTRSSATPMGLQAVPNMVVLPQTRAGETSAPQTVSIINTGLTSRTVLDLELGGMRPEQFDAILVAGPGPHILAPGESTEVSIWSSPDTSGHHGALLRVLQSPVGDPETLIRIDGLALGPLGEDILVCAGRFPVITAAGLEFAPEFGSTGTGTQSSHTDPIIGSEDDALYQELRVGRQLEYGFNLPQGAYDLTFHFAEPEHTLTGQRVFEIAAEGQALLPAYDVIASAGQMNTATSTGALRVNVQDGVLNVSLTASVGQALFQALEVRAAAVLELTPADVLDFGTVDQGLPSQLLLAVENTGLFGAHLTGLTMEPSLGSAQDFVVQVDGVDYSGSDLDVAYGLDLWIQPGETIQVPVTFTPTEHAHHHFDLSFSGGFDQVAVEVEGVGDADSTWGFLHPTISRSPTLVVDYNGDGSETILLSGAESHTHEPGRSLVGYDWELNGVPFASAVETTLDLPLGPADVSLTITDDGTPPFSATVHEPLVVHSADQVPEVLALYYHDLSGNPNSLLDAPPVRADFIDRIPLLRVTEMQAGMGTSPFSTDVMLELRCTFDVSQSELYHFIPTGGSETRVLVDGLAHSAAQTLSPGLHQLTARFALNTVADLPVNVTVMIAGVAAPDFADSVVHDENGIVPVIHTMPTLGIDTGGATILIDGFGFYPQEQMTLHWGGTSIPASALGAWSADRLLFVTPPGTGTVSVWVETPAGSSNAIDFEYSPSGPLPIVWDELTDQEILLFQPTTLAFGPDGRLYVGQLSGHITVISLDTNWDVLSMTTYPGVSSQWNNDLLGIAFDPYDSVAGGDLKVYVAHGAHYANGGGSFSGPSAYSGQVSILEGPNFDNPIPIVTGLPVSNHDHGINGLEFDHDGNLLIAVGGNTNAGVKWPLIGDLPESPLSAAVIRAWIKRAGFDGSITYELSATGAPSTNQVEGELVEVSGGSVSVVASGLRNAYDLVLSTKGLLYVTDNGPNAGYGPESTGPNTMGGMPHPTDEDELDLLEEGRYFGHPNRSRGRWDARQNVYHSTTAPPLPGIYTSPLTGLASSADGIVEYRSAAFGGQLRGDLMVQKWNSPPRWVELAPDGRSVEDVSVLSANVNALDLTTGPAGVLISADFSNNKVHFIAPASGLTGPLAVFDVHPWRAPETGGGRFVIGGRSFGDLSNTSVFFGGVPVSLLSVEATRIVGILPAVPGAASATLVEITVQVGAAQAQLPEAFRWLPATPGWSRGAWSSGTNMPDPLGEVAAGVVAGRVIMVGEGSSKTYGMDLSTGLWDDTLAQRPFVGHHHAAEVVDGKFYLFGSVGTAWGKVQIYDPLTDSWTTGADMPWGAGSCSSAVIDGMVYVCGGIVGSNTVGNAGVYDPVLDSWNPNGPLPPMPTPVNHAASATDGTYLWVFGGRGGGNWPQPGFDNVQRFDPATGIWLDSAQPLSPLSPMPLGRGGTGRAVWHGERFFVMGGETSGGQVFDEVQVYTPELDQWSTDTPLPTPRHGIFPVVDGNRIFVIGGGVVAGHSGSNITEVLQR